MATAGASLGGLKRRNPPPGSLPAVGWKLFASLLAVSPRARSGNSRLSRSRGSRHGRLGRNSLRGDGHHIEKSLARERRGGKRRDCEGKGGAGRVTGAMERQKADWNR